MSTPPQAAATDAAPATAAAVDRSKVAPWWHTAVFLTLMSTYGWWGLRRHSHLLTQHTRSHILGYLVMILVEFVMFGYVWLLGFKLEGKTVRQIIGGKWSKFDEFAKDFGIAMLFWIVVALVLLVINRNLGARYEAMKSIAPMLPQGFWEMTAWLGVSATAGFCEETIFRGYLQKQFYAATGNRWLAAVLQATVFGWVHLYQGVRSAISIGVYGTMFGILAILCKSLRPGMMQHFGQDAFSGIALSLINKYKFHIA